MKTEIKVGQIWYSKWSSEYSFSSSYHRKRANPYNGRSYVKVISQEERKDAWTLETSDGWGEEFYPFHTPVHLEADIKRNYKLLENPDEYYKEKPGNIDKKHAGLGLKILVGLGMGLVILAAVGIVGLFSYKHGKINGWNEAIQYEAKR